jgi:hypothetical protein
MRQPGVSAGPADSRSLCSWGSPRQQGPSPAGQGPLGLDLSSSLGEQPCHLMQEPGSLWTRGDGCQPLMLLPLHPSHRPPRAVAQAIRSGPCFLQCSPGLSTLWLSGHCEVRGHGGNGKNLWEEEV